MASLNSHLLNPAIRALVKSRLSADVTGRTEAQIAKRVRGALGTPVFPPPGGHYAKGAVGGIAGLWTEAKTPPRATVLYIHGGGFLACSPGTHRPITYAYGRRGFRVFAPDYRLAPEHRFPAAIDDALAAYRGLLAEGTDPRRLVVSGDSAGGGLTLSTLLAARDAGLPMPACAVVFSPWTDLACGGESMRTNMRADPMLCATTMPAAAALYLGNHAASDPLASPLLADLSGLPPLSIHASAIEVLRDDSTRLATRAREAGVEVSIRLWDNMPHVWPMFQLLLPEAREVMDEVAAFIGSKTSVSGPVTG